MKNQSNSFKWLMLDIVPIIRGQNDRGVVVIVIVIIVIVIVILVGPLISTLELPLLAPHILLLLLLVTLVPIILATDPVSLVASN